MTPILIIIILTIVAISMVAWDSESGDSAKQKWCAVLRVGPNGKPVGHNRSFEDIRSGPDSRVMTNCMFNGFNQPATCMGASGKKYTITKHGKHRLIIKEEK